MLLPFIDASTTSTNPQSEPVTTVPHHETSTTNSTESEELEVTSASLSYLDQKIMIVKSATEDMWNELTASITEKSEKIKELRDADVTIFNKLQIIDAEINNIKIENRNTKVANWENVNKLTTFEYNLNKINSTSSAKFHTLETTVNYLQSSYQERLDAVEGDMQVLHSESTGIVENLQNLVVGAVKRIEALEMELNKSQKNVENLKKEVKKLQIKVSEEED